MKYIGQANESGLKSFIYCNDIQRGAELKELLGDAQQVYSDEEKNGNLLR